MYFLSVGGPGVPTLNKVCLASALRDLRAGERWVRSGFAAAWQVLRLGVQGAWGTQMGHLVQTLPSLPQVSPCAEHLE